MINLKWISIDWDFVSGALPIQDKEGECIHCSFPNCWTKSGKGLKVVTKRNSSPPENGWIKRLKSLKEMMERITPKAVVFRDSHAHIYNLLHPKDFVYHIDSHSDFETNPYVDDGIVLCGTWVREACKKDIMVKRSQPEDVPEGKYKIFICLSRPYSPERLDGELLRFLASIPTKIDFLGTG